MSWMNSIVSWLKSCEQYFYDAYLEVYGWVYPLRLLSYPLLYISRAFGWLAYYFSLFNNWLVWATANISNILSWDYIKSLILGWLPWLTNAGAWFQNWWNNTWNTVCTWWSGVQTEVKGWIAVAVQPFNGMLAAWNNFWNNLWPQLTASFNSLKSAWDNFWSQTLPSLVSNISLFEWWNGRLQDVQGLINTGVAELAGMMEGWQNMRDQVVNFFTDPVEYIWQRFADWFLGPEV